MADGSLATDVAIDSDVIRRVGEDDISFPAIHEPGVGRFGECVAAGETMISQQPDVARLGNRRTRDDLYRLFVLLFFCGFFENQIDFRDLEARDCDVELEVNRGQMLQLDRENRVVPVRFLGQPVSARM